MRTGKMYIYTWINIYSDKYIYAQKIKRTFVTNAHWHLNIAAVEHILYSAKGLRPLFRIHKPLVRIYRLLLLRK